MMDGVIGSGGEDEREEGGVSVREKWLGWWLPGFIAGLATGILWLWR